MTDTLAEICSRKRQHVAERKRQASEAALTARLTGLAPPRGFLTALETKRASGGIGLIAEVKKASPSRGVIREDFDPVMIATAYARAGAACLSVLTDAPYFQGEDAHFTAVRDAVSLPMIRKDFMIDPYQVVESRALGADAILLIVAALDRGAMQEIEAAAHGLGMDVLVEVHDDAELDTALACLSSRLVGINNRDLKTLRVDLATTFALAPRIPAEYTIVSESGIATGKDVAAIRGLGVDCFLVGESLMRQADVEQAARGLVEYDEPS